LLAISCWADQYAEAGAKASTNTSNGTVVVYNRKGSKRRARKHGDYRKGKRKRIEDKVRGGISIRK
jgi:hypothetical protein